MREPHEQEVANQFGPESCADLREEVGEAFDRGKSRPARRIMSFGLHGVRRPVTNPVRRPQFTLRAPLLAILVVAELFQWIEQEVRIVRERQAMIAFQFSSPGSF
jgi:hypothetical protein